MITTQHYTETIGRTRTFDGIEDAAHRVIEQIGGMASIIRGANMALLKPNFVAGRRAETGATTSLALIKAVADEVRACGAEPVLCETPGTEFDREATYAILGIEEFCKQQQIGILRLDPEGGNAEWREVRPAGARKLRRFHIPSILKDARLINLPVLKTHVVSTMTLSMKNLMGLLPRPDRRAMHTFGIDQCIVDMNLGLKPDLHIVDGSVGQDGEGPLYGDKADLQVLLAGRNALAVDLACCKTVGVDPAQIPHLRLALQQQGIPQLEIVGTETGVIKQFRLPEQRRLYRLLFWMMYPLDYPYSLFAKRGQHLCTSLYSSGLVGTRPQIHGEYCTRCARCIEACPLPNVINLQTLQVNYKTCQRCLLCAEACPEGAISIQGLSGAQQ